MVGENPHASGSGQVRMHHQPEGLIRADLRLQALQAAGPRHKVRQDAQSEARGYCGKPGPRAYWLRLYTAGRAGVRVIHWAAGRCWWVSGHPTKSASFSDRPSAPTRQSAAPQTPNPPSPAALTSDARPQGLTMRIARSASRRCRFTGCTPLSTSTRSSG